MTHICVGKLTIIGSDNGLSPARRQAIIWTNAGILLIGPLRTNFSEILIEIQTFSLKKIGLKMSSAKCSFLLGLNVLTSIRHQFDTFATNRCRSYMLCFLWAFLDSETGTNISREITKMISSGMPAQMQWCIPASKWFVGVGRKRFLMNF